MATAAVIAPPSAKDAGELRCREEEAQLQSQGVPEEQQIGYLRRDDGPVKRSTKLLRCQLFRRETNQPIAAIVVGFKPIELRREQRCRWNHEWDLVERDGCICLHSGRFRR